MWPNIVVFFMIQKSFYSATLFMTHYNDQCCTQMFHRIFNTSEFVIRNYVSGGSDGKNIAKSLIKYLFGRHTRIRTTDNNGKRLSYCN